MRLVLATRQANAAVLFELSWEFEDGLMPHLTKLKFGHRRGEMRRETEP
jgi:hypothetical protein